MKDIGKISSIKEKKADYDDAPEDLKGTGKMEEKTGTCRFCGQLKAVRIFPGEDPDMVATDECDCPEAKREHDINTAVTAVSKNINKKFKEIADKRKVIDAIEKALEPVARDELDSAVFKINGFTFTIKNKDGKLSCEKKYTEIEIADENGAAE